MLAQLIDTRPVLLVGPTSTEAEVAALSRHARDVADALDIDVVISPYGANELPALKIDDYSALVLCPGFERSASASLAWGFALGAGVPSLSLAEALGVAA